MLSGGYNTDGKVSPLGKRKREKAQLKLRDRMRKKMHGSTVFQTRYTSSMARTSRSLPTATASGSTTDASLGLSLLQTRLSNPMTNTSRSLPAVAPLETPTEAPRKSLLHKKGYWRTQHDRYDRIVHPTLGTRSREDVAIQDLVGKVAERRERHHALHNNSLLTIRSYKRPTGPYAIQQQPLIKKMVSVPPLQPTKTYKKKGPLVLVLQTATKTSGGQRESGKHKPNLPVSVPCPVHFTGSDSTISQTGSDSEGLELDKPLPQLKTWKPNAQNIPAPAPCLINEGGERCVTNYRLEYQQANRLAEARFQYSSQHSTDASVGHSHLRTLRKFSALPSIPSVANKAKDGGTNGGLEPESEASNNDSNIPKLEKSISEEDSSIGNHSQGEDTYGEKSGPFKSRKTTSNEILEVMEAKKRAKRAKRSDSDFQTLLRTRHKYTTDMRIFKDDLLNMRKLSIISETSGGTPDELQRVSSGERTGSRASIASLKNVSSLEKIDEANIIRDSVGERITPPRALQSPGAIYLIKEEPGDGGTETVSVYAPPTTPVLDSVDVEGAVNSQTKNRVCGRERTNPVNDGKIDGMRWISGDDEFVQVM